jgi:hypothetical protein
MYEYHTLPLEQSIMSKKLTFFTCRQFGGNTLKRKRLTSLLILTWCCAWLFGVQQNSVNKLDVVFGFSDITGKRIISVDTPAHPEALTKCIFQPGVVFGAKFLGQQKPASDWNGRQTARDFDKVPGSVYQIERGPAPRGDESHIGEPCLLVTAEYMSQRELLEIKPGPSTQSIENLLRRIERARGKKAAWAKSIARIGPLHELILVQFFPEGQKCIASLVLAAQDFLSFDDLEARYDSSAKNFFWRADTDGINSESFHVLAASQAKEGLEIAVLWDAFEGQDLLLLKPEGAVLHRLFVSYRYWAPI